MFLLMPTCNSHASIVPISLALLDRYWPGHPAVHVLHFEEIPRVQGRPRVELHPCGRQEDVSWVSAMRSFLEARAEELVLVLLDDYALCGPARVGAIEAAERTMREDRSIGLFPLCWYPAVRREPRGSGMVGLFGLPILLQAAIWRREWFIELARQMDRRTSAWGFEARATQLARREPGRVCAFELSGKPAGGGFFIDAIDKSDWPLPYHNLMHRGEPQLAHGPFLRREGFAFPARGLGDTVARMTQVTGIAQLADAIERATGRDCGCAGRRANLNRRVPYQ